MAFTRCNRLIRLRPALNKYGILGTATEISLTLENSISAEPNGSFSGSLTITYEVLNFKDAVKGSVAASIIFDGKNTIRATLLVLDISLPSSLRGRHLGTYLIQQLIHWLTQWPTALVKPLSLSITDARDADNRARRHALYKKAGFEIIYDADQSGSCLQMPVTQLLKNESWTHYISEEPLVALAMTEKYPPD